MKLLSTTEAAERLGVSSRRVRVLIAEGKLPAHKLDREYAIEEKELSKVKVIRRLRTTPLRAPAAALCPDRRLRRSGIECLRKDPRCWCFEDFLDECDKMLFSASFWFANEVGFAACVLWFTGLVFSRFLMTKSWSQEVNMMKHIGSSLMVSIIETLWAVEANVLAA